MSNMFNLGAKSAFRGLGHIFLQALRIFTIITLLSIAVSSWAMVVKSGLDKNFNFFDAVTHILASAFALCLIVSELDMIAVLRRYFERSWPTFSPSHSLAWLGLAMIMLGCQVIGDQSKDAYSQKNISLPLWRLILASGILGITFGAVNILSSLVFRDGESGITARLIRRDGNLAAPVAAKNDLYDSYSQRSATLNEQEDMSAARRVTRMFNVRNFRKSKLEISKPIIHLGGDVEHGQSNSSLNDRASPIMPEIQRPPTALHPVYTGSSRYSEAHISRF